ncbi:hypothetical protein [Legionella clemsonensis]|uniref:Uncharacterized protein n=1 Tax=Legionella clemsonensis TaxID=1867846 RepID=A0A222P6M0_9GAMM|nr:hypothetical protein [Legionella clemsonensis]ASQ47496.1 hypothetical protein clem_14855 [Legionella clemsonensis]
MKYSLQELVEMENPYELLITKDKGASLNESREAIQQLSVKQRTNLITKLILQCPGDGFNKLNQTVHHSLCYEKFAEAVGRACILNRLIQLLQGEEPHLVFNSPEYSISLFHEFSGLVAHLIPDRKAISERLAAVTPKEQYSRIARQLDAIFSVTLAKVDDRDIPFGAIVEEQALTAPGRNSIFAIPSSPDEKEKTTENQSTTEIGLN